MWALARAVVRLGPLRPPAPTWVPLRSRAVLLALPARVRVSPPRQVPARVPLLLLALVLVLVPQVVLG